MDAEVVFMAPDGAEKRGATVDDVRYLLLKKPSEYWEAGCGDAGLRFFSGGRKKSEMILMVREPHGVFVQHLWVDDLKEYAVQRPGGNREEQVTVIQGGDPWTLPRHFFVSKDDALKAIETFFENGGREPSLQWSEF